MTEYKGVTLFHSETGTEGGYWAMQDEKFMNLPAPDMHACARCGRIWDKDKQAEPPSPTFSYWHDEYEKDGTTYAAGFQSYDEPHPELSTNDDRYVAHENLQARLCYLGGHAKFRPLYPNGMWSYEGLHVLHDGDHLTVYEADGQTIKWEGEIKLLKHDLFTEDAGGMWIHADQEGVDRDEWAAMFFKEHPCKLVTKDES